MTDQTTSTSDDIRPLPAILAELGAARNAVSLAAKNLANTTEWESALKDELRAAMEAGGVRTSEAYGVQAQIKTRKSNTVSDVAALADELRRAGILDDFLILDKASATKVAVKNGWDCVEASESTYISIKEV